MRHATEGTTFHTDPLIKHKKISITNAESILASLRKEQQQVKALEKELISIENEANSQLNTYDDIISELENKQAAIAKELSTLSSPNIEIEQKNKELIEYLEFITNASEYEVKKKEKELKATKAFLEEPNIVDQFKRDIEITKMKQRKYRQKLKNIQTESISQQKMEDHWKGEFQSVEQQLTQLRNQVQYKALHN